MSIVHDRVIVHTDREVGHKQSFTPEGFLLCEEVPIARTGIQEYLNDELVDDNDEDSDLSGARGKDGIIKAERREEDVFRDETLASFEGKPVVDDHPEDDQVGPHNFKQHVVGVTLNPRRGADDWKDYIIADLLIQDGDAIEAIQNGKREVSAGYDAEYEALGPGRVRQHNIIANHVALVDRGRCGHHCSIKDTGERLMAKKTGVLDRLMSRLGVKDKSVLKKAFDEAGVEMPPEETNDSGTEQPFSSEGLHIHIHGTEQGGVAAEGPIKTSGDDLPEAAEASEAGAVDPAEGAKTMEDRMGALEAGMASIADTMKVLHDKFLGGAAEEEAEEEALEGEPAEGEEEETGSEPDEENTAEQIVNKDEAGDMNYKKGEEGTLTVKDAKGKVKVIKDSAPFKSAFSAAVAGCEIIAPGLKMPTFDSKAKPQSTMDGICLMKRRALAASIRNADGAEIFKQVSGNSKMTAMTCDSLGVVFNAVVALTKDKNDITKNSNTPKTLFGRTKDEAAKSFTGLNSPADFNKAARAKYGQPTR